MKENNYKRVLQHMQAMGIEQMLLTDPAAVFYLTGKWIFPGERFLGLLIRKSGVPVLYVNELFCFEEEIGAEKVYFSDTDNIIPLIGSRIAADRVLGVDKTMAARFLLPMMENSLAAGYRNTSPAVDLTRAVKDAEEIEKMKRSSHVNDLAMEKFKALIHDGVTEIEVASQMLDIYRSLGASCYSFDPIVAFGQGAADPHHMPDDTVLKEGDCILLDVGCVVDDYCSDMTRTFFWKKEPDNLQKEVYNLVRRANEEAEEMLKPGIPLKDVDKKARDIITAAGHGPEFTHRLGHFIGIEDHEYGDVSSANENLTMAGNIFSIEPGVYVTGRVGVRIEDLVLITPDGYEVLNSYPKEIEVLG
jgi:Xaa-Pro dipeptidase